MNTDWMDTEHWRNPVTDEIFKMWSLLYYKQTLSYQFPCINLENYKIKFEAAITKAANCMQFSPLKKNK